MSLILTPFAHLCYNLPMLNQIDFDNTTPAPAPEPPPDLARELTALLHAGCKIEFKSHPGDVMLDVLVFVPHLALDVVGGSPTAPIGWSGFFSQMQTALPVFLRTVRLTFVTSS